MIRSLTAIAMIAVSTVGCSGDQTDQKKEEVSIVPGFSGGCEQPFVVYVQNQFKPLGASLRDDVDKPSEGSVVYAGKRLLVTGWFDTGDAIYPDNPDGIQGDVWYYIPKRAGWVPDAGVRTGSPSSTAPPDRPAECELQRAE